MLHDQKSLQTTKKSHKLITMKVSFVSAVLHWLPLCLRLDITFYLIIFKAFHDSRFANANIRFIFDC